VCSSDLPPLKLTRHAEMRDPKVQAPRLLRQYIAPSLNEGRTEQTIPLSLMAQYLGGGPTSLLYQSLVREQQLASAVSTSYDPFSVGPSVFHIYATPRDGVSLERLEKAIDAVVEQALGQVPPDTEVARAKTQLKAAIVFAQDGLQPLAQLIGWLYMLGLDERYFYGWEKTVESVTAMQMLEAAQATLAPERRVTGYLLPEQEEVPQEPAPMPATSAPAAAPTETGHAS
jgi:zinc protease